VRRARPALLPLLLLLACGEPIGTEPLRFETGVHEVALGRRFDLAVVRVWNEGDKPVEWDEGALDLRLRKTEVREAAGRIEETRRYDAYAFSEVAIPGLDLTVRRALDPAAPGEPELPDPPPSRWGWWVAGAFLLAAILLLARRRRPPPPAPVPEAAPVEAPRDVALRRLAALRESAGSPASFARELAALLRDFRGGSPQWSTEEFLAAAPADRAALAPLLFACDRVKFARHEPGEAERARLLDAAESFVREAA